MRLTALTLIFLSVCPILMQLTINVLLLTPTNQSQELFVAIARQSSMSQIYNNLIALLVNES